MSSGSTMGGMRSGSSSSPACSPVARSRLRSRKSGTSMAKSVHRRQIIYHIGGMHWHGWWAEPVLSPEVCFQKHLKATMILAHRGVAVSFLKDTLINFYLFFFFLIKSLLYLNTSHSSLWVKRFVEKNRSYNKWGFRPKKLLTNWYSLFWCP